MCNFLYIYLHLLISYTDRNLIILHSHCLLRLRLNSTWCDRSSWSTVEREAWASSKGGLVNSTNASTVGWLGKGVERADKWSEGSTAGIETSDEWQRSDGVLGSEANGALSDLLGRVHAVGQDSWVDWRIGIDGTPVAANGEDLWLGLGKVEDIGLSRSGQLHSWSTP